MIVQDILWRAREDYLDDTVIPYLWKDETLLQHLNTVLNEWCRETGCLRDSTTEAICKHLILPNKHTYPMDPRITEIHKGYKSKGSPLILPKDDTWLDDNYPFWRRDESTGAVLWLLPDYDQNYFRTIFYPATSLGYWTGAIAFTGLSGTIAHTIGTTEGNFSTLLAIGDQVVISGSLLNGTMAVPKVFTLATVTTDSFTVSEAVADETLLSGGIIQKVIDTMWLTVSRLPLTPLTVAGMATQTPEIRSDYHPYLIHGICREAYSMQDSQCLDVEKAKKHKDTFEYRKNQAMNERDNLRRTTKTMKPHPGAL